MTCSRSNWLYVMPPHSGNNIELVFREATENGFQSLKTPDWSQGRIQDFQMGSLRANFWSLRPSGRFRVRELRARIFYRRPSAILMRAIRQSLCCSQTGLALKR